MVLDKNSYGYREEYDGKALHMIADMAKKYVTADEGSLTQINSIPDGTFSDFSCTVWELMVDLVRYGKKLAEDDDAGERWKGREANAEILAHD